MHNTSRDRRPQEACAEGPSSLPIRDNDSKQARVRQERDGQVMCVLPWNTRSHVGTGARPRRAAEQTVRRNKDQVIDTARACYVMALVT